ncbi:MAG TPA: hypothetical protein VNC50_02610 [Planctomycetia bacterium]|nr:hypothetical protein [Planctomycetia bacterium]
MSEGGHPGGATNQGLVQSHGVSLGCGTLILIALIVMIFSNAGRDSKKDFEPLKKQLDVIEMRITRVEKMMIDKLKEEQRQKVLDKAQKK